MKNISINFILKFLFIQILAVSLILAINDNLNFINEFNLYTKKIDSKFHVNILATKWQIHDEILTTDLRKRDLFYVNKLAKSFFFWKKISYLDFSDIMIEYKKLNGSTLKNKKRLFYINDSHWNEVGQKITAEATFNYLDNNFK